MALKIAMGERMLLSSAGKYFESKVEEGKKVYNLFICPWCMGTLQSITAHLFAFGLGILPMVFTWQLIIRLPLVIFGTSLISGLTWTIYEAINTWKEKNDWERNYYQVTTQTEELREQS